MQCYVAAEWLNSDVRPPLQHVNAPRGRMDGALCYFHTIKTLQLNKFNENQCRRAFHYDALSILSRSRGLVVHKGPLPMGGWIIAFAKRSVEKWPVM